MSKIKRDKFKSARGGYSRLYTIACGDCATYICVYQKDGPGLLRRMYIDRMDKNNTNKKDLLCPKCNKLLGSYIIYEQEDRPAYRLYVGSITKSLVKTSN